MTTTQPDLAAHARLCWSRLTDAANPWLLGAAFDLFRIESGCEDVPELKKAVYAAAAEFCKRAELKLTGEISSNSTIGESIRLLAAGDFARAERVCDWIPRTRNPKDDDYDRWHVVFSAAIAICRAVEELPE